MPEVVSRGCLAPAAPRRGSAAGRLRSTWWPVLLAIQVGLAVPRAHAADFFWSGLDPFSPNWNLILNWEWFSVPPNNGTARLIFGPNLNEPIQLNSFANQPWSVAGLEFGHEFDPPESTPELQYAYALYGQPLTIGPGGIWQTDLSDGAQIHNDIVIGASQRWGNTGGEQPLTIYGDVDLAGRTLIAEGWGIWIDGVISGVGRLIAEGFLSLAASNTYTLGTIIRYGHIETRADEVIPPGTFEIEFGDLDLGIHAETIGPGAVEATGLRFVRGSVRGGNPLRISTLGIFIEKEPFSGGPGATIEAGILTLGTTNGTRRIVVGDAVGEYEEMTISSDIINPGSALGPVPAIEKSGAGRLVLSGNNTFPRGLLISEGPLRVGGGSALGAGGSIDNGTRVANGAVLELSGGVTVANEYLALAGTGDGGGALQNVDNPNRWNGPIELESAASIGVGSGTLTIGGIISGTSPSHHLTKVGSGPLVLEAANTYAGNTIVALGRLRIANGSGSATGTGAVSVASGATLEGAGTISGNVAILDGGALAPGASAGNLSIGELAMASAATLRLEIGGLVPGTQHDQVTIAGHAGYGGTLEVALVNGFVPSLGDEFTLGTHSSASGAFASANLPPLPPGRFWALDYGANALRLMVTSTAGVDEARPRADVLHAPRPNPTRARTAIPFVLADGAYVSVRVYDVSGRLVARLVDEARPAGTHEVWWDGTDETGTPVPAGTYFARLAVDGRPVGVARAIERLR